MDTRKREVISPVAANGQGDADNSVPFEASASSPLSSKSLQHVKLRIYNSPLQISSPLAETHGRPTAFSSALSGALNPNNDGAVDW